MDSGKWCRSLLIAGACVFLVPSGAQGQLPGINVNMVAGTQWPGGDPFLQRQNEPALAASSRNPLHLMAGANDYRTVDLPGLPSGRVIGDAWAGIFKSFDGGKTWRSTLLPGFPQDVSPEGMASPLHGFEAAADPVMRAGTNGMFYFAGIVLNRTSDGSGLFVARWIDNNNKENGDPIGYIDTKLLDLGNSGKFIDKPWLAVDVPRSGAGTCTVSTPGVPPQSFAAGNVYVAYTVFVGNDVNIRTKVYTVRSRDCGATWTAPQKLSEGYPINQGTSIAIDPATGHVYIAWRQVAEGSAPDAILMVRSTDGGVTFSKAWTAAVITPFEQGSTGVSFRTTGFPTMTFANGRLYLAWSQRGVGPNGDARILIASSGDGGTTWTTPVAVANDVPTSLSGRGHQLMPSIAFSAGKLTLAWYDQRLDHTIALFEPFLCTPSEVEKCGLYEELRELKGDLAAGRLDKVFWEFIADTLPSYLSGEVLLRRHTLDLWVGQAEPPTAPPYTPTFTDARVSNYAYGVWPGQTRVEDLQINPPNLPMFLLGTRAFIGDYVDVAPAPQFVPEDGSWAYNVAPSSSSVHHVVWTDNRDVRPPAPGKTWADYTPPFSLVAPGGGSSLFDPSQTRPTCLEDPTGYTTAGMRNQNVYTSRITEGLVVASPGNTKPLGTTDITGTTQNLQRTFVVLVQNTTNQQRRFRLTLTQPLIGHASFLQFESRDVLEVEIPRLSGISRPVFVTSTDLRASVTVDVTEIVSTGEPLAGYVVLNPDISNPELANPELANPDLPSISEAEVYNPELANPELANPELANPELANPELANPELANPELANPELANPELANPELANPELANPELANPELANATYTDVTWETRNEGNTTASYGVKMLRNRKLPTGFKYQLVLHRTYQTPIANGCDLAEQSHEQVVANIVNPVFLSPDPTDPSSVTDPDIENGSATNATIAIAPGQVAKITLRIIDPDSTDSITLENPDLVFTPVVVSHAVNTVDALTDPNPSPPVTLTIVTGSVLPDGVEGTPYSATLAAVGGAGTYSWSLANGSLPPGLSLTAAGQITGTPTQGTAGTYGFTIEVDDSGSPATATRAFTIRIAEPLSVVTTALPDGLGGAVYQGTLAASGGTGAYTWSANPLSLSALGLTLNPATGFISGTAVTTNGPVPVLFTVTDQSIPQQTAQATLTINVLQFLFSNTGPGAPPVIDGVIDESIEWSNVPTLNFEVQLPEGGTALGKLYLTHWAPDFYVAVRIPRAQLDASNRLTFYFSDNLAPVTPQLGDDVRSVTLNAGPSQVAVFEDRYRTQISPPASSLDTSAGGATNGEGSASNHDGYTDFEFKVAYNSGDPFDLAVGICENPSIAFWLQLELGDGTQTLISTFPFLDSFGWLATVIIC